MSVSPSMHLPASCPKLEGFDRVSPQQVPGLSPSEPNEAYLRNIPEILKGSPYD